MLIIYGCTNGPVVSKYDAEYIDFDTAKDEIPLYFDLISIAKEKGYVFWSFRKYWESDKSNLPEKLMVIRHDVHHADIYDAYCAHTIERELLGHDVATYYVMLDNPEEMLQSDYADKRINYLNLMRFLKSEEVDLQPHISPISMYVISEEPFWKDYSKEVLQEMFESNYEIQHYFDGIEISVMYNDVLNLFDFNEKYPLLFESYKEVWIEEIGLDINSIAAHGSALPINQVINNAVLLDQRMLINLHLYDFDAYNTVIFNYLQYLSDNYLPEWMYDPEIIEDNRYQFLMHPRLWTGNFPNEDKEFFTE